MEIYRFRPSHALLDGYHELENQQIYFASPNELNDPMEGFRDFFWKGDGILWRNLIKHYLFCLEHIYTLTLVAADTIKLSAEDIPLHHWPLRDYPPQRLALVRKISDRFFSRQIMNDLPAQFAIRANPIRKYELLSHLMFLQTFAMKAIEDVYLEEGIITKQMFTAGDDTLETMILKAGSLVSLYNQIETDNPGKVDKLEKFFQVTNTYSQTLLLSNFADNPDKILSNSIFLISNFNEAFVERLEKLIYPDWHSASFLSNCTNSAIWGHYGDNHKGICLIYQPQEVDGEFSIDIKMITGANSKGPTIGMSNRRFQKVKYDHKHIEVDFFRSLGRAPIAVLESNWYKDESGEVSSFADHLYRDTDQWRETYWKNFQESVLIKAKEWEYEQEYRLTIDGNFNDYTDRNSRKLEYRFEDLKGIIFGIKTSQLDKMKIIKIIREKCRDIKRTDFEFYQAYYSRESTQIERELLTGIDLS